MTHLHPKGLQPPSDTSKFTQRLAAFRQHLENELGASVSSFEPSALLVLNDLCDFLELPQTHKRTILGNAGLRAVKRLTG